LFTVGDITTSNFGALALLASRVIFLRWAATAAPVFLFGRASYDFSSPGLGSNEGVTVRAEELGVVA
jgi:hypothetical protein